MAEAEATRETLEEVFAGTLLWADPVRRLPLAVVREITAACAERSLAALGLVDETPGDPELMDLLAFGRARFKPWAEATAARGIEVALREPLFAHLSRADRQALAARLNAVVDEKLNAGASS